jgi:hypothetical protein
MSDLPPRLPIDWQVICVQSVIVVIIAIVFAVAYWGGI